MIDLKEINSELKETSPLKSLKIVIVSYFKIVKHLMEKIISLSYMEYGLNCRILKYMIDQTKKHNLNLNYSYFYPILTCLSFNLNNISNIEFFFKRFDTSQSYLEKIISEQTELIEKKKYKNNRKIFSVQLDNDIVRKTLFKNKLENTFIGINFLI